MKTYLVINLDGEIVGTFYNEAQAHNYADQYGIIYGRFAYVETEGE